MKIGLFDSGLGGLNVLKELLEIYPNNEYIYYGDTLNLPYGNKSKDELLLIAKDIIKFFEEKQVNLIIIACGTMSSNCFNEIKNMTKIPVIDIISPTIKYLEKFKYKKVLVFGTIKTIESKIFSNNLNNIIEVSTPEFVPMIENNNIDENIIKNYLKDYQDIDALVLGCTHYPLLVPYFKKYLPNNIKFINMGKILLNNLSLDNKSKYSLHLYFTKIDDTLINNINKIIKTNYIINN